MIQNNFSVKIASRMVEVILPVYDNQACFLKSWIGFICKLQCQNLCKEYVSLILFVCLYLFLTNTSDTIKGNESRMAKIFNFEISTPLSSNSNVYNENTVRIGYLVTEL